MDRTLLDNVALVVEDHEDIRGLMVDLLEFEGFEVLEAGSGRAALAVMEAGVAPCLIVTDLMMPEVDGWQLLAALDAHPDPARTVVVLSAIGGLRGVQQLEDRYGCTVLRKPEDLNRIAPLARDARLLAAAARASRRRRAATAAPEARSA